MKIRHIVLLTAMMAGYGAWSQEACDGILGVWQTHSPFNDDTANIRITRMADGTYSGQVIWTNHPTNPDGSVRRDVKNKDKKLRTRTWDQVKLCWNLQYKDGQWIKGDLYDPYSGKYFNVKVKPKKGSRDMEARYYMGVPSVGITMTWKRIK